MPNLDGGHYFLTVLAPILVDPIDGPVVGRTYAHRQQLAQKLALMAIGRQTSAAPLDARPSPLAKNTLNHLARFVIIDGPAFNGRVSGDSLVGAIRGVNPLVPQTVDRLDIPYLLFAADIDAPGDGEAALRAYTDQLWATMKDDLAIIFGHCAGFAGVKTADAFHNYIRRCQVETTMPFNDYWADGLDVGDGKLPIGWLKPALIVAGGAILLWLAALFLNGVFTVSGATHGFAERVATAVGWGALLVPLAIAVAVLVAYLAYRQILGRGMTPFPTAPGSDLPSVLKALFVQQHFTRFAIEAQGLDDDALHTRFGAFLDAVKPGALAEPTHAPGEIRAPAVEWAR